MRVVEMNFIDILKCYDVGKYPPKEKESLLRANLGSLLQGLNLGHIQKELGSKFLIELKEKWQQEISIISPADRLADNVSIETLYLRLVELYYEPTGNNPFVHTNCSIKSARPIKKNSQLCTIKSQSTTQYWVEKDAQSELNSLELRLASVDTSVEDFKNLLEFYNNVELQQDVQLGPPNASIWLTLLEGEIGDIISKALKHVSSSSYQEFMQLGLASLARNRLGLWRIANEHVFAVILKSSLADFVDDPNRKTKTPTVFDASEYERFRHWPTKGRDIPDGDCFGRTYELNRKIRQADNPDEGCAEFVTTAIPLKYAEKLVYLGVCNSPSGYDNKLSLAVEFADEVCFGASLETVLSQLESYT